MTAPGDTRSRRSAPVRFVVAFGLFWWDFLVGDTPELLPGVLLVLGAGALVVHLSAPRAVVVVALPVVAAAVLLLSVLRGARPRR